MNVNYLYTKVILRFIVCICGMLTIPLVIVGEPIVWNINDQENTSFDKGVTRSGSETLKLISSNTYKGDTIITARALVFETVVQMPDHSKLSLGSGVLNLGGLSETSGDFAFITDTIIDMGSRFSLFKIDTISKASFLGIFDHIKFYTGSGIGLLENFEFWISIGSLFIIGICLGIKKRFS